ncbi:MAG: hypothetical protein L0Z53_22380 [Acidobacteriales bacterium]|nr:hypothetical protein [Terriglobales bacterium]
MATAVATKPVLRPQTSYDRVFYSSMAIVMALTVFAGFAPTYYLKIFGQAPLVTLSNSPFTPLVHIHGLLFTAWVALFIIQTALVASHRVAVHRRMGVAGALLAASMLVVGTTLAIDGAGRGAAPPGVDPLAFLAIPLFDMLMFSSFVTTALWLRTNKEAHKRLMLLAYISIIVAAVARMPGVLALGPPGFFGLASIFLLAAVIYDFVTRRRVHPVYLWGGGALIASQPLRLMISGTAAWRAFAEFLTR